MSAVKQQEIEAARSADLLEVVASYGVAMQKDGTNEYKGLCPFHSEKTPSFSINTNSNRFYCFGCGAGGEGGDPIEFVKSFTHSTFIEAVKAINGTTTINGTPLTTKTISKVKTPIWIPSPLPDNPPPPPDSFSKKIHGEWVSFPVSARWTYRDAAGALIGYVCRFELPDGGKDVIPQIWALNTETGEIRWKWLSFGKPRPLYGLDLLAQHPNARVLVVEGEKTADAARKRQHLAGISPDNLVVVTWPGGGKGVKHVDWSPLYGRKVALWPDADAKVYPAGAQHAGVLMPLLEQPGMVAMMDIATKYLKGKTELLKIVLPPDNVEDGWDLADDDPSGFEFRTHLGAAAKDPDSILQANQPEVPVSPLEDFDARPDDQLYAQGDDAVDSSGYFRILGYDHNKYYVMQEEGRQIHEVTRADFTDVGMVELAPWEWWRNYFEEENGQVSKKRASNWFFRRARSLGIYDPSRTRGRGAWIDNGRVVLHIGRCLYVDGVRTDVTKIASQHVYELDRSLPDLADTGLTPEERAQIFDIAKRFRWTKQANAALLVGWIALAPVCGAIKWRPHIWITGGAGSGKSTILNDFIAFLLGEWAVFAQGNSTEAGIRQTLRKDARPVLIDENESNEERDRLRVQGILAMVRQASSESSAMTFKGTTMGSAMHFHVRSMFALASIQVALKQQADIERLSVLALKPKHSEVDAAGSWAELSKMLDDLQADKTLPQRLHRHAMDLLPVTTQNIKVFARAGAEKWGNQRDGDQYGTLMAGCWSMFSDKVATPQQARDLLDKFDWSDQLEHVGNDEARMALSDLLGQQLKVGASLVLTVYEMIRYVLGYSLDVSVSEGQLEVAAVLARYGMRVEHDEKALAVSNRLPPPMQALMEKSQFGSDLRGQLLRLAGAIRSEKAYRFAGEVSRATLIPLSLLFDGEVLQSALGVASQIPF